MLIEDLKKHETEDDCFYRFTIQINAGGGVLKSMAWRYYPETRKLKQPSTPVGGSWASSSSADKDARKSILRIVESLIQAREV